MNKKLLFLFVGIYCVLFILLYPWYQYVFDADAIGYLKVAQRIAQGDLKNAVNGCWSPLNSWLLVPFIKWHVDPVFAAKMLNGLFGTFSLISFYFLLKKFVLNKIAERGIMVVTLIAMLHFAFFQLFGDLLQVLILINYLNVVCAKNFISSNKKIIGSSILCGVAYYAKYYSLYFGFAFIPLLFFLLLRNEERFPYRTWIQKTVMAWSVLLLLALPWAFVLKEKYGEFTFATTGKLDQSWFLSQAYQQPKVLVQPLPYADSYSHWDDPSVWKGDYITPFTNKKLFLFQIKLLISNKLKYIGILNEFSFLAIVVLLSSMGLYLFKKTDFIKNPNNYLILAFALVMPLGYLLIYIEERYVWMVYLILLILSGVLLTVIDTEIKINSRIFLIISLIVFASFCIYPLNELQDRRYSGKNTYDMAAALNKQNIHGRFIASYTNANEEAVMTVLPYWTNSQFYGPSAIDVSEAEIMQVIKEYHINYYLLFYYLPFQKERILSSGIVKNAKAVLQDVYPGLIVLRYE